MKSIRILPYVLIVILVGGFSVGCSRGPSEEELKLAELQQQFVLIEEQHAALEEIRANLKDQLIEIEELEAIDEKKLTEEQKLLLEEGLLKVEEISAAETEAFEEAEANLAEFLNTALNDYPDIPETKAALDMYSAEAILVAQDMVTKAGDYSKAIDHLYAATSLYEQVGLDVYPALDEKIAWLNDWRFITQERFDAVEKGMTKEEVQVVVGVPYYQNIQKDSKRGVETWLYRKTDGGAAAIYFKMKDDKAYNKNFDAIKVKVVE